MDILLVHMVVTVLLIRGILSVCISLNTSTTNKILDCLTEAMVADMVVIPVVIVDLGDIGATVDDLTEIITDGVTTNAME